MRQRSLGTILSYVYMVLHIIVNMLYVPMLLRYIGQSEYGLYQIIGSVMAYFTVMESSLSAGILRFYCKYRALNDNRGMENTLAIAKCVYYALSMIVIVLGCIGEFGIHLFYKGSFTASELFESELMFAFLIINLVVTLTNYVYVAAINGNEKFVFIKIVGIISMLLQPICVMLAIKKYPYAITIVIVQLIINCAVSLTRRKYATDKMDVKIVLHEKNTELVKAIIKFSAAILLASIADQIFWKTDQIIIGKFFGTTLVSVYSVGAQIYTNYMPIGTAISGVFMPHVSELYTHKEGKREISNLFVKVGRISSFLLLMVLTGFAAFGQEFLQIWVGNGYRESYYIALVVMIPFTIDLCQNLALTILQVYDKYTFRARMYFIVAIMNIGLTIMLISIYGIIGAALATGISMFIGNGIIMNIYYSKIGIDVKMFWKNILPIIFCSVIAFLFGNVLKMIHLDSVIIQFGVHISLYVIMYAVLMYCFVFNDYEKGILVKIVKKFIRR